MDETLTLLPRPPKASDWQTKYLREWRALIKAQRTILDAQEHLLDQQDRYLIKLEKRQQRLERATDDRPARKRNTGGS